MAGLPFSTLALAEAIQVTAPDGSDVRVLPALAGGSMAHFTLAPGAVSRAVAHRTVEEIWFVVAGEGEMWRRAGGVEDVALLAPGVALTIPLGSHFQFRCLGDAPLRAIAITMPPWPGEDEALLVDGPWISTLRPDRDDR